MTCFNGYGKVIYRDQEPPPERSAARHDLIEHYVDQLYPGAYPHGASILTLLTDAGVPEDERNRVSGRFGQMLAACGWASSRPRDEDGNRRTVWKFVGRLGEAGNMDGGRTLFGQGARGPAVEPGSVRIVNRILTSVNELEMDGVRMSSKISPHHPHEDPTIYYSYGGEPEDPDGDPESIRFADHIRL